MNEFVERRLDRIKRLLDQANPPLSPIGKSRYLFSEAQHLDPDLTRDQINQYLLSRKLPAVTA